MTELELKIYDIVRKIPSGRVATYGQVAKAAGNAHLSRVVGNAMHKNPVPFWEVAEKETGRKFDFDGTVSDDFVPVPCHRVVNAAGKMGANFGLGGPAVQAAMLRAEGVDVGEDLRIVDLKKYAAEL